jgi:phosphoesterase family protein
MRKPRRCLLRSRLRLAIAISTFTSLVLGASVQPLRAQEDSSVATPVTRADIPLNLAETPDGFLISTNSGYGPQYLLAYDETRRQNSDRVTLSSLWYGLSYEPKQQLLLASDGNHSVFALPFKDGRFGEPRSMAFEGCEMTAGLEILDESTAVVACNQNHLLVEFDVGSGRVLKRSEVGEFPYALKLVPGKHLAVSDWGQSAVDILDASTLRRVKRITVGSHPSDMLVTPGGDRLLVACADADLVSVINLKTLSETRRLDIRIPDSPLGGAQPDALAFDAASGKLFVALAAVHALAVFDLGKGDEAEIKFEGLLPVGPYPTSLLYSAHAQTLFIANGRNAVQGPNSLAATTYRLGLAARTYHSGSGSPLAYIGYLMGGSIEGIAVGDFAGLHSRMTSLARQVYGLRRELPSARALEAIDAFSGKENPEAPIHHVIYIIKENRTYDQVLGDMKQGNGEAGLTLFGEAVTPNQHQLARQFVLFDNFYVDGDVSADGHMWSTTASATDYVNKLWPSAYGSHVKIDFWGQGYDGDDQHDHPIGVPASGFIWDLARAAGVSYRDYGEWCVDNKQQPGTTRAFVSGLKDHYDPRYLDTIGATTDRHRIEEWDREFHEFERKGDLPQLTIMHLPNDHTMGTRPGSPTPRAMVADNDEALGRLVEVVSHSRFWRDTAIFVLEDDAQDGPDHIDAHRSTLFVISPYVHHGLVEHARFSTVSVLKTIEQLLGLGSLTYFDDRAPSLLIEFDKQPVLDPYTARRPEVSPDELNAANAPGARQSARWDFSHPDAAPEQALNRVIWQSIKGRDSEPPAPVFSVQSAAADVGLR